MLKQPIPEMAVGGEAHEFTDLGHEYTYQMTARLDSNQYDASCLACFCSCRLWFSRPSTNIHNVYHNDKFFGRPMALLHLTMQKGLFAFRPKITLPDRMGRLKEMSQ